MHLSEWHTFNLRDRKTYPKVDAPIQVQYESGQVSVGFSHDFFPAWDLLPESLITCWRYIKAEMLAHRL
jgi:hypothetical protein